MKQVPWIIIAALLVAIIITRECTRVPEVREIIRTDTLYLYDTVVQVRDTVIPVDRWHFELVEVPADVDTAAILADYFARVRGRDTIVNDSSMFVAIDWQVSQNRLQWVVPTTINRRRTAVIHNTTIIEQEQPRNHYYYGFGVGRSPTEFGLTANLMLITKKNNAYTVSFDLLNKDLYLSLYYRF